MRDLQEYYLKSARDALTSLNRIVGELDEEPVEVQTIRNACSQAQQVFGDLSRMCGVAEQKARQKQLVQHSGVIDVERAAIFQKAVEDTLAERIKGGVFGPGVGITDIIPDILGRVNKRLEEMARS